MFFCKQKTAYEMRISDWSSEVCSSDLLRLHYVAVSMETTTAVWILSGSSQSWNSGGPGIVFNTLAGAPHANPLILLDEIDKAMDSKYPPTNALYRLLEHHSAARFRDEAFPDIQLDASAINRSEEPTSELKSLMRITYAVFCLNKKTNI